MCGEKFWIPFKYEKLPLFYFTCGEINHDCGKEINLKADNQYGVCLRAENYKKREYLPTDTRKYNWAAQPFTSSSVAVTKHSAIHDHREIGESSACFSRGVREEGRESNME